MLNENSAEPEKCRKQIDPWIPGKYKLGWKICGIFSVKLKMVLTLPVNLQDEIGEDFKKFSFHFL